ncbi:aspartate aminotransferase family protein [Brevifollis gellanilyticus]|uniref:Acetylornithine aminotransferase n=1 Tax=Brevifollis gellanilyticus TaxID=748831 RepID=A0A512M940_9BACT|nr:aminotransferase class III-fold pyridoxal phosphate-dependent enzyme [Brevifollis gellanilyticus]GEP43258.1 acetylornithine aminotransferase [Brevifollis gellanilyticus]
MDKTTDFDPAWLNEYVLPNYGRYNVWPVRGEGPYVWDRDGKKYLDFAGGVAVCPLGHCPPPVVKALTDQANTLIHVSNWYCIDKQAELARILIEECVKIPGKCFFSNSGAEANEGLLKLARKYGQQTGGRYEIITFTGSFHGRTFGAMTATAQEKIHGGFGPLPPGFVYVPFNDVQALEAAITDKTVAILVEPVQGESGVNAVTPDFLRNAQRLCKEKDLLLLLDEVQVGFGRAGELTGWRAIIPGDEIQPDGISWAKAIGSGFPLGGFWVNDRRDLSKVLGPGTHGTTYGGSPLACAVGIATLRAIIDGKLCDNAKTLGASIAAAGRGWNHPLIKEVRQLGLFIGWELNAEAITEKSGGKLPSIFLAQKLLDAGMMVTPAGPNVVRWLSPLNITAGQAEEGLTLFKSVLDEIAN